MPEIFLIADTLFGDAEAVQQDPVNRPFDNVQEHDADLIRRWNATVGQDDVVYVLGDFAVNRDAAVEAVTRLNGVKKLVLGDRDMAWYPFVANTMFAQVCGPIPGPDDVVLSHMPVWVPDGVYKACVHGHTRSGGMRKHLGGKPDTHPRYHCVSVEHTNLTPVSWDAIKQQKTW